LPEATSFLLPIPLDVESVLEALLPASVMGLGFRPRSAAAGAYVAELIRAEAARRPQERSKVPPPPKTPREQKSFYDAPTRPPEPVEEDPPPPPPPVRVRVVAKPPPPPPPRLARTVAPPSPSSDLVAALHRASDTARGGGAVFCKRCGRGKQRAERGRFANCPDPIHRN
jgi:hypothetical protein